MRAQPFALALSRLTRRRPFRPFTVELLSLERLTPSHPEAMTIRDRLVTYVEPDRTRRYFDASSVLQVYSVVVPPG